METKNKIIVIFAVSVVAIALIAPVSADFAKTNVELVEELSGNVEGKYKSVWTYRVTASGADISHWVLKWCNPGGILGVEWTDCTGTVQRNWEYDTYTYKNDGEITGIKFESKNCDETVYNEDAILFTITLQGYYDVGYGEGEALVKDGEALDEETHIERGVVDVPVGKDSNNPCLPYPEQPTILLTSVGVLALAGYFGLRRRKDN